MTFAADGVSAAILAGGGSTRMGRDKALIPIDGIPMIQRILGTLQRVVPRSVVISDRMGAYGFLGVPVHPDVIKDRGPAAGIHSALLHASTDRVLIVPCDMPYLSEELLRHIMCFPDPGDACVLEAGGIRNPLCGLYHRRILPIIKPEIQASRHPPQYLLDLLEARTVTLTPQSPVLHPSPAGEHQRPGGHAQRHRRQPVMTSPAHRDLDPRWIRAALLGSIWASTEIILGSFLHNVGIPFTGTVLAAIGTALAVAGSEVWGDRGLLWRSGLVCALMKSVSPSAVILGPMIGIMLEAGFLEAAVRLLGRNPVAYVLGGMLAVTTPLLQKLVSLVVVYGWDMARVYVSAFDAGARYLGITALGPVDVLFIFAALHGFIGIAAAVTGYVAAGVPWSCQRGWSRYCSRCTDPSGRAAPPAIFPRPPRGQHRRDRRHPRRHERYSALARGGDHAGIRRCGLDPLPRRADSPEPVAPLGRDRCCRRAGRRGAGRSARRGKRRASQRCHCGTADGSESRTGGERI